MTTLRTTLGKFALPLVGIFLVLLGITMLTSLSISPIILGAFAVVAGICCLFAS
jgi:hypothetical protein